MRDVDVAMRDEAFVWMDPAKPAPGRVDSAGSGGVKPPTEQQLRDQITALQARLRVISSEAHAWVRVADTVAEPTLRDIGDQLGRWMVDKVHRGLGEARKRAPRWLAAGAMALIARR